MTKFQAIKTKYNGYKFRSRLETHWAVYFNELGVEYQYEIEGIDLQYNGKYLPDFLLFGEYFLEIKPRWYSISDADKKCWQNQINAISKVSELSLVTQKPVYIAFGDPLEHHIWVYLKGTQVNLRFNAFLEFDVSEKAIGYKLQNPHMKEAIIARESRFEFGETPKVVNENGHSKNDPITRITKENRMVNCSKDVEQAFEHLQTHKNLLSQNNIDFIYSLERGYRDYGTLTERQFDALVKKVEYVNWQLGSNNNGLQSVAA